MAPLLSTSRPGFAPPQVENYRLLRTLGFGAFGEVWLAEQLSTRRKVAIKFYVRQAGLDLDLLRHEVDNLAHLATARDIVQLLDVGWEARPPYYVMEYLPRGSLEDELLRQGGVMSAPRATALFRAMAQALLHVHGRGVLHCDLKPANVLLGEGEKPLLADFGQARFLSEQDPAYGTFFYMAPEQAQAQAAPHARWDIYALGAIFYRMLTGGPPHKDWDNGALLQRAPDPAERLARYQQILRDAPPPAEHRRARGVDGALAEIIDRCLAVDPERRFQSAAEVVAALEAREQRRGRLPLLILGALGPVLLLLVMALFAWGSLNQTLNAASEALIDRLLTNSQFTAQLAADRAAREIEQRLLALAEAAADPQLLASLGGPDLPAPSAPNEEQLARYLRGLRERPHLKEALTWFVLDARGTQIAREPRTDSVGRSFAFRDYFHGQGAGGAPPGPPRPIQRPHLSLAYISRSSGQPTVTLSAPVWGEDAAGQRSVRGVLCMGVGLGHFGELPVLGSRVPVLFDVRPNSEGYRGLVLQHPQHQALLGRGQRVPVQRLDDARVEQLRRLRPAAKRAGAAEEALARLRDWRDPVGGVYAGRWLAAAEPVLIGGEESGWVMVVQEHYGDALRPLTELRGRLLRNALLALLVVGLVLSLLWGIVIRALGGASESRAAAWRPWRAPPPPGPPGAPPADDLALGPTVSQRTPDPPARTH